ncbi:ABC transporter permease [Jeotgalibacillus proteolyticus]|uniref:ABC transporter permease n=1 Tax=Jeotgalibacillus proteolyticus TaxID=2082395 RepID=UPI003CE782E1
MIWQFIKKQGLLLWRNPMQLLLVVGLPIVLITILGTALGGTMNGEPTKINLKVALIEHEDEEKQIDRFIEDFSDEIPPEMIESIQKDEDFRFIQTLKSKVFGHEDIKAFIDFQEMDLKDKDQILNDSTYTSAIEVPEHFTYEMLEGMLTNQNNQPALLVLNNEGSQVGAKIVNDILVHYQEEIGFANFLTSNNLDPSILQSTEEMRFSETVSINQSQPVTSKGYYTVGMAVMNVLFVASTIGTFAFLERKIFVFNRIILANVSRWIYFSAVCLSGTLFSFCHLLIVFGFAWVFFDVSWANIPLFLLVSLAFAISVGGIAALLTAISYRFKSEVVTSFFSSILVTIMAVLGGSFFPLGDSSVLLQTLGNFTPNGAGMSAYLAVLRGDELEAISEHLIFLVCFGFAAIAAAAFSFPKRGSNI